MAEENQDRSPEDLSEEASPHRLEEFRQKGQVAQSRELSAIFALAATTVVMFSVAPEMGKSLLEFMREVLKTDLSSRLDLSDASIVGQYMMKGLKISAAAVMPIAIAGFIAGGLSSFAQVGSIFTLEPLTPDINRVNPLSGFQKIFSMKQVYEGVRILVKLIAILCIVFMLLRPVAERIAGLGDIGPMDMIHEYADITRRVLTYMFFTLLLFAAVDYILIRRNFMLQVRLTKEEAKQEYKEREGDPQIKARIRSVQREMARKRMMQAVKKADVIITNPTHIAIAIQYDKTKMKAPKVIAKGADLLAQKIKQIAAEAGVPLVENVPLARALFKSVKIGRVIPNNLYQAVAEVLAYVYKLKNESKSRGGN